MGVMEANFWYSENDNEIKKMKMKFCSFFFTFAVGRFFNIFKVLFLINPLAHCKIFYTRTNQVYNAKILFLYNNTPLPHHTNHLPILQRRLRQS